MEHENVEKTYQKKSQLEHILLRPDTYIGSVEHISASLWVLDETTKGFVNKTIEYVPGLYKIFDEILVNAADNFQRDHKMDTIKVKIDKKNNVISVWNNGKGIPVQIHKEHNLYVPDMIFGHLLTSSNYDDSIKKITGGRNGYGAKLTNAFSKRFTIETGDSKLKKTFTKTWTKNMGEAKDHQIESYSGNDYTCITFEPDLKKFGMKELDESIVSLMQKRVYDLAGVISNKVNVYLNDKKIPIKGFQDYVDMYLTEGESPKITELKGGRWEVCVTLSEGQFQQVSFVNSICTSKGGTHVNYVADQIVDEVMLVLKKKHKDLNVKPFQIKSHLFIFVNCLIENPAFDSQTKDTLTSKASNFGSSYQISEKFIKDLMKTSLLDKIVYFAKEKEQAKMAKSLTGQKKSRLLGIPKLEDANDAGTRNSENCTLILTEGDSAKSLAMAGIEVVGRDKYGVFPLKGKLLNVREATAKQCTENQELQNIIKIIGLQFGKAYENAKSLRYGSIIIMSDQDYDGSHIKGLVINFLHHFWPSLLKIYGFLKEFVTPIIKATKNNDVLSFFTIQDFKRWQNTLPLSESSKYKIKYYKGLGTSTNKEAKEYFQKINKHQIFFKYLDRRDDENIDLAFNKKKADDRKEWLLNFDPENTVDHNNKTLRYADFIDKELIQFSISDNMRSIPSICDGLKPGQRKILFACFKRNLKAEIKVAQLSGYVAEHSAYHHGEMSLSQTIIGMAQDFAGSNNINLLLPIGQFGSRNMGGKDSASARYIFTNLHKITRILFNENDDSLYDYLEDDGDIVEPKWYLPIIPMVLANGAEGIGTGWSTSLPCYNPVEIAECFKERLQVDNGSLAKKMKAGSIEIEDDENNEKSEVNNQNPKDIFRNLKPWFRGFHGDIIEKSNNSFLINGKFNVHEDNIIEITELPIGKWTREYKNFLESKLESSNEDEVVIEDIKEFHSGNKVHFVIKLKEGKLQEIERTEGIEKFFKLSTTLNTSNMVLFDPEGKIKKYNNVSEIMEEFYKVRLDYYEKRKQFLIAKLLRDYEIVSNKAKFINEILNQTLILNNLKKKEIISLLIKKNFKKMSEIKKKENNPKPFENEEEKEKEYSEETEFNYLLNMPIWTLSHEKVEALHNELKTKKNELDIMMSKSKEEMWITDLNLFIELYEDELKHHDNNNVMTKKIGASTFNNNNNNKKTQKTKKVQKPKDSETESEEEYDDEDSEFELKNANKKQTNGNSKINIQSTNKNKKNKKSEESEKELNASENSDDQKKNLKKKINGSNNGGSNNKNNNQQKKNNNKTKMEIESEEEFKVDNKAKKAPNNRKLEEKPSNKKKNQSKPKKNEGDDFIDDLSENDDESINGNDSDFVIETKTPSKNGRPSSRNSKKTSKIDNIDSEEDHKEDENGIEDSEGAKKKKSIKEQLPKKPEEKIEGKSDIFDNKKNIPKKLQSEKKEKEIKEIIKPKTEIKKPEEKKEDKKKIVSSPPNKKYVLENSILKYLKPASELGIKTNNSIPISQNINITQNPELLSLEERIKLRESKGDLKAFDNAYQVVKSSPNKTEEILKKRERSDEFDIIEELEETLQKKKIKPNEEIQKALDSKVNSDEELSLKPIRNAAKSRKRIIESDDD